MRVDVYSAFEICAMTILGNESRRFVDLPEYQRLEADLAKEREKVKELDTGLDQALRERDAAEDIGTRLAEVVGGYFRVEVGEHSNMNDPREMAIAILEGEYQTDSDADRKLAAAQATIAQMREAHQRIVAVASDMTRHGNLVFRDMTKIAEEALSAPTSSLDALHEARALECERLKEVAHTMPEQGIPTLWLDLQAAEHRERKSK